MLHAEGAAMLRRLLGIALFVFLCAGCRTATNQPTASQTLTPERVAAIQQDVTAYAGTIARDITTEGPSAWRRHFADSPAFFMASEGRLVFPDSASATAAIQELTRSVKHIELTWGDDLRVDPLAPQFAVVGASYHEIRVETSGKRIDEKGFFTATAENANGRWQLRDAHWSVLAPPAEERKNGRARRPRRRAARRK
jgi:hypothetical protein